MSKELMDVIFACLVGSLATILIFMIAQMVAHAIMDRKFENLKKDAIKKGYAKWVVSENGTTGIEWNDGTKLSD